MNELNVMCPINGTGYGITSTNIIKQIGNLGTKISLFPIGSSIQLNNEEDKNLVSSLIKNSEEYNPDAKVFKIWHQHDLAVRPGKGEYFTYPFFEIDKLSKREVHCLNSSDGIFTASKWGKTVLEDNGVNKPIVVAPLGVDMDIFKVPNGIYEENEKYTFLHIGKWEKRKAQDFLIKCFENAFTPNDEVELWLLPTNPFLTEEELKPWHSLVLDSPMRESIKVFQRLPTQYHVAEVIHKSDCGIFLSRAEGWNNEIPEMMALNKPIIATNFSAHTEYLTSENSLMVNVDETEPAHDGKWFFGNGNWGKLSHNQMQQTIDFMRFVYNKDVKTNPAGLETAKKLSWTNTASIINQTIFN